MKNPQLKAHQPKYSTKVAQCLYQLETALDELPRELLLKYTDPREGDLSNAIDELLEASHEVLEAEQHIEESHDMLAADIDRTALILNEVTQIIRSISSKRQFLLDAQAYLKATSKEQPNNGD